MRYETFFANEKQLSILSLKWKLDIKLNNKVLDSILLKNQFFIVKYRFRNVCFADGAASSKDKWIEWGVIFTSIRLKLSSKKNREWFFTPRKIFHDPFLASVAKITIQVAFMARKNL